MFHKIQILPTKIQNPFLEIHPFTGRGVGGGGGGANISWLVYKIQILPASIQKPIS